ncbi:hypothetical protein [Bacillus sp. EB01]|uniref:hypothetical protein n=1 Tax=Bacillus sp. EB01 TaxID=1347086 RepID=UPI0005C79B87|nr:hypothetical protein [Bacillus sp. EB01]
MKIKPRYTSTEETTFKLTLKTRKILEHYSEYTGLTPAQILEEMVPELLGDEDFIEFVESKRSNLRMKRELGLVNG